MTVQADSIEIYMEHRRIVKQTSSVRQSVTNKQTNKQCVLQNWQFLLHKNTMFWKRIHLCHQVKSGKPTQLHPLKHVINRKLKGISYKATAEAWPHCIINEGYALFKQQYWNVNKVWVLHILLNKAKECS